MPISSNYLEEIAANELFKVNFRTIIQSLLSAAVALCFIAASSQRLSQRLNSQSVATQAPKPQLNMLVLGDSVMWGQSN